MSDGKAVEPLDHPDRVRLDVWNTQPVAVYFTPNPAAENRAEQNANTKRRVTESCRSLRVKW